MERLTTSQTDWGHAVPVKLDIGFALKMPEQQWSELQAIFDKLSEYEDAEEQERMVVLPCKTGETVFRVRLVYKEKWRVESIPFSIGCLSSATLKLGVGIYATREEADEAIMRR